MSFEVIRDFEIKIAEFYGSPYAVAVDCCTHAIELCLRYEGVKKFTVPPNTYPSIPNLAKKIGIEFEWKEEDWKDFYYLGGTGIIDAAVLWKENSYIPNSLMCLSFQFQKHLSLGRGGMILTDDYDAAHKLTQMSYDGRIPNVPWREQNIDTIGYHYYMTPETASLGLEKLPEAIKTKPRDWELEDWPDLREMELFKPYLKKEIGFKV
jgi:dTDP-4-amino-4,6-dideoxygalactose transaminase